MKHTHFLFALLALAGAALPAHADVRLPRVFGDHMVLQRGTALQVWGTADPGEKVTVQVAGRRGAATAAADGTWRVGLTPMKAETRPQTMVVKGKNELVFEDILIGDVWIGSGQSNMEWSLRGTEKAEEFMEKADYPNIRLLQIPKVQADKPAQDVTAAWAVCDARSVASFSAVLYHFGKIIHEDQKVPIGLINSSWGGSPIEPWIVTEKDSGKMYNGMIAPLAHFGVTGVIWYQGETNVIQNDGLKYYDKMKDLIGGWRAVFRNEKMPFYFVQIAPWDNERYAEGQLPALWEAQCAALKLPNTGMAVTTDIVHDLKDIHPKNKHDVGDRLARWALAKHYGKSSLAYSGPLYKAMRVEGDSIRLAFAHVAGGLKTRDDKPLNEFQIAGADGKFVVADAKIEGKTVLVRTAGLKEPTQVRFGWHRVAQPNLINSAGLPASPFQTENWTGGTGE